MRQALQEERARVDQITDICRHVGLAEDAIRELIVSGQSVDAARKAAMDHLRAGNQPIGPGTGGSLQVGLEAGEKFRAAALDGLLIRSGHQVDQPAPGATDFRGMRLLDIVRESLELSGTRTRGMDPRALAGRALTPASTSDFPDLLAALVNKTLLASYTEAPATWRPLVAVSDASDFKQKHAVKLSSVPDLLPMNEHGEYRTAELTDSRESYAVTTRGRIIRLTRQMIINDDLGGFTRIARGFGFAARRWENQTVYGLITGGALMSDGLPLFDAGHNNTLQAAALGADSLSDARAQMRQQVGMAGELLDVTPQFLVAGADLETTADIILRSASLPILNMSSGAHNPWAGKLTPITDPLIASPIAWYLFASPSQYPVIEVAWLMGDQQPFVDDEVDFASDSLGVKVRHDFGAGIVDWVGAVFNPGA